MAVKGNLSSGQNAALVMLAFLQADCGNAECREELLSLGQEINFSGLKEDLFVDADLEPDGYLSCSTTNSLDGIQPSVELHRPGTNAHLTQRESRKWHLPTLPSTASRNHAVAAAAALHQVAEELREIAAQVEHNVVARATQNLSRNIKTSPLKEWKDHLSSEVDQVMRQGRYLSDLPQEQVIMALTLTLVKGVCEQTPYLLRNLFNTALQYITQARPR